MIFSKTACSCTSGAAPLGHYSYTVPFFEVNRLQQTSSSFVEETIIYGDGSSFPTACLPYKSWWIDRQARSEARTERIATCTAVSIGRRGSSWVIDFGYFNFKVFLLPLNCRVSVSWQLLWYGRSVFLPERWNTCSIPAWLPVRIGQAREAWIKPLDWSPPLTVGFHWWNCLPVCPCSFSNIDLSFGSTRIWRAVPQKCTF